MAVKIIDPTPDPKIVKQISCSNCGVRLEYVPNDVEQYVHHDYGGGSDVVKFIRCPACTKEVIVAHY